MHLLKRSAKILHVHRLIFVHKPPFVKCHRKVRAAFVLCVGWSLCGMKAKTELRCSARHLALSLPRRQPPSSVICADNWLQLTLLLYVSELDDARCTLETPPNARRGALQGAAAEVQRAHSRGVAQKGAVVLSCQRGRQSRGRCRRSADSWAGDACYVIRIAAAEPPQRQPIHFVTNATPSKLGQLSKQFRWPGHRDGSRRRNIS